MSDQAGGQKESPKSFEELVAAFEALQKRVQENVDRSNPKPTPAHSGGRPDRFTQFTTSGLFFMIVGATFLIVAAFTLNTAHASFSFVLVVIGVAVLLFGTGTQGVGEAQATGYKVAIAGGAGVIAFCVGWGIVVYADAIKTVFQVEKKYIRLALVGGDGSSNMSSYVAAFTVDGAAIPAARHSDFIEVFIPYFASDWRKVRISSTAPLAESGTRLFQKCSSTVAGASSVSQSQNVGEVKDEEIFVKTVRAALYRVEAKNDLRENLVDNVTVRLRKSDIGSYQSGFDFPVYPDTVCVSLLSQQKAETDVRKSIKAADEIKSQDARPIQEGPLPAALIPSE